MRSEVDIVLAGLPESVHWVANALDEVLPGAVAWHEVATLSDDETITLEGIATRAQATIAMAAAVNARQPGIDVLRTITVMGERRTPSRMR